MTERSDNIQPVKMTELGEQIHHFQMHVLFRDLDDHQLTLAVALARDSLFNIYDIAVTLDRLKALGILPPKLPDQRLGDALITLANEYLVHQPEWETRIADWEVPCQK